MIETRGLVGCSHHTPSHLSHCCHTPTSRLSHPTTLPPANVCDLKCQGCVRGGYVGWWWGHGMHGGAGDAWHGPLRCSGGMRREKQRHHLHDLTKESSDLWFPAWPPTTPLLPTHPPTHPPTHLQGGGKLVRTISGPAYEVFARLLRGLSGAKLTKPGTFRDAEGTGHAVRCSYKVGCCLAGCAGWEAASCCAGTSFTAASCVWLQGAHSKGLTARGSLLSIEPGGRATGWHMSSGGPCRLAS